MLYRFTLSTGIGVAAGHECLCLLCTKAILEKSCEDKVFNGVMNILYSNIKSLNDKIADLKNLYMIDKN